MKKCSHQLLLALASVAIAVGCARTRTVARTEVQASPIDPAEFSSSSGSAIQTHPAEKGSSRKEFAKTAGRTEVRLVNSSEDAIVADDSTPAVEDQPETEVTTAAVTQATELTLEALESIALQCNPTLVQAQAEIEVDQGFLKQAGLYPNPQVGYINGTASNPSVKQSNGIFLSQEFVTANKLDLAQQSILQEIKQMQWDQEAQRMRVMNDLKIRYYEVLGAQHGVKVARKLVTVASEGVQLTEKAQAGNIAARSDVLQAKIQLETARLSLDDAEYRYTAAWQQLAVIVGMPSLQPVPLAGDVTTEIPERDEATCIQTLLAQSPQLAGSGAQLDHGWAEYRSQCAQGTPNVTVQAVIDYDRATQATTASTLIAMPLPIHNWNQGNRDKAAADIRLFQAEITRVELVLRDQLADSFRRYKSSRRQVQVLKDSILRHAEENLKLTREAYEGGQLNLSSVLTAQQTYFQSELAYVEAMTELNKVVVEIDGLQLTGGLNPPAIGSAIQAQPGGGGQRQRALLKDVQDKAQKQLLPAAQIGQ